MELRDEIFARDGGILPESKFPVRSRNRRVPMLRGSGILPTKEFVCRSTVTSLDEPLKKLGGISPDRLLRERFSSMSDELLAKDSGMVPSRLFLASSRLCREVRLPMQSGRTPVSSMELRFMETT
ncbi:Os04g0227100 [Oryza sativa Japonica Group]|uniref:Os04g0227100 protein n=2 Tax=Oryza sativa subsp. japonica TaxID=39947 RepID=Q0JEN9_ORYSJ|nr:Os04g0227100 [Oryza sativa Japonica Group]BAS88213.1 Os04g0227100 [Oryza sativa Japonica Group]|eukprot:NP_001052284.1 Os04g0227100 [Oryza sativa Japonica Group]